jgi:lipid-A-disaccharide synthase
VIPEFIQEDCTPEKLAASLRDVLADTPMRRRQVEALARLDDIMATGEALPSVGAANIVLGMLKPRSDAVQE